MIEKLKAILADQGVKDGFAIDAPLDDLGLDSLEFVVLMQEIGDKFWEIPQERWSQINTLGDIERELIAAKPC